MSAIVYGFVAPKGGVGKSAITVLAANWINYILGKSIMVIDADPQGTIIKQRAEDTEEYDIKVLENAYPVEVVNPEDVPNHIKLNKDIYDYISVDLAGTMAIKGNIQAYASLDKIIIPTSTSKDDMKEVPDFIEFINEEISPIRVKMGKKAPMISVTLNRVSKQLKEYKELARLRNLPGKIIKRDINAQMNGNFTELQYYYPFEILDADITESKGVFGQYINTVINEVNIEIAERFSKQCEAINSFLTR